MSLLPWFRTVRRAARDLGKPGSTTVTLPGGREVEVVEWGDFYLTKVVDLHEIHAGPSDRRILFAPEDFPQEVVIRGLKIDASAPPAVLAQLWICFQGVEWIEFPCSAFDRNVLRYVDISEEGDEGEKLELREVAPKFNIPLMFKPHARIEVYLYAKQDLSFDKAYPLTVTLGGIAKRATK